MNTNDIAQADPYQHHGARHAVAHARASWLHRMRVPQVLGIAAKAGGAACFVGAASWVVGNWVEGSVAGSTIESMEHWIESLPPNVGVCSPVGHPGSHRFIVSLNYVEAFRHLKDLPLYAQAQVLGALCIFAGGVTGLLAHIGADLVTDPPRARSHFDVEVAAMEAQTPATGAQDRPGLPAPAGTAPRPRKTYSVMDIFRHGGAQNRDSATHV